MDEIFHEKEIELKFLPEIGSLLEIDLNPERTIRSRYRVEAGSMRGPIPVLHLKYLGRNK